MTYRCVKYGLACRGWDHGPRMSVVGTISSFVKIEVLSTKLPKFKWSFLLFKHFLFSARGTESQSLVYWPFAAHCQYVIGGMVPSGVHIFVEIQGHIMTSTNSEIWSSRQGNYCLNLNKIYTVWNNTHFAWKIPPYVFQFRWKASGSHKCVVFFTSKLASTLASTFPSRP